MGIFNSIGHVLGGIGKVALPVVGGIFGGPLGAAAGGALSGALGGGGVKGALTGAAVGGLGDYAVQQAGGSGASGDGEDGNGGGGGGLGGLLSRVGSFAAHNPGLLVGAGSAALGALQQSKAGGYQQQALDLAKTQYGDAAPLRAGALAGLAGANAPNGGHDLSWMTGGNNPYLAKPSLPVVGGQSLLPGHSGTRSQVLPGRGTRTSTVTNTGSSPLDVDQHLNTLDASPVGQAINGGGGALGIVSRLQALDGSSSAFPRGGDYSAGRWAGRLDRPRRPPPGPA